MGWSRVATAHHYPSDVVAGVALAAALAFPLSRAAMAFL
jgi:undecaprenyl-diphosphatase